MTSAPILAGYVLLLFWIVILARKLPRNWQNAALLATGAYWLLAMGISIGRFSRFLDMMGMRGAADMEVGGEAMGEAIVLSSAASTIVAVCLFLAVVGLWLAPPSGETSKPAQS